MKNLIFLLLFIFTIQSSFGQISLNPTKKNLLNAFKKQSDYNTKDWTYCNTSEKFFKSDTLYFYESKYYENCKKTITWCFKSKKSFYQLEGENHGEYGSTKVLTDKDFYKVKISENENQTFLYLYNNSKLVNTFLVFRFEDLNGKGKRITLIRIKK